MEDVGKDWEKMSKIMEYGPWGEKRSAQRFRETEITETSENEQKAKSSMNRLLQLANPS